MSISRLFKILTLAGLFSVLVIGAVFTYTIVEYNKETRELGESRQLLEAVFYLNWLTSDYSEHAQQRQETQWLLAQKQLDRLLTNAEIRQDIDPQTWQDIRTLNVDLTDIFSHLLDLKRPPQEITAHDKILEGVLYRRLAMKAEELFLQCFDLDRQIDVRIHDNQIHALLLVSTLVVLMVLTFVWLAIVMHRRVIAPLRQLRGDLVQFTGEMTSRPATAHQAEANEMAAVKVAFNEMKSRLALSYAKLTHENHERTKAEQQTKEALIKEHAARKKAEELACLKDEFLMGLSHELRTPLNAILGFSELIQHGAVSTEKIPGAIDIIVNSAKAEVALVNDMLDMSATMTGHLPLQIETLDLPAIVSEVITSLKLVAEAKHLAIHCNATSPSVPMKGDPARLRQIVSNLLTNALKFTPEHGRAIEVTIESNPSAAQLTVRDFGIGIRANFLPFVFDKFRQEDASLTRKFGGLGIGLNIVRSLVELHGGSVTVESKGPGEGARFIVCLPRGQPSLTEPAPMGLKHVTTTS